jgi:hypothetical protein
LLILKLTWSLGLLLTTSIDLSKSLRMLASACCWSDETTSVAAATGLARIDQLKRRFLSSVNLVLKFFVVITSSTIWPALVVRVATSEISATPQTV